MPVQRIPRYKLLLTELLKYTPEDHSDYQDLAAAVSLVSGVVNSINEDIKRQEKRFKVSFGISQSIDQKDIWSRSCCLLLRYFFYVFLYITLYLIHR